MNTDIRSKFNKWIEKDAQKTLREFFDELEVEEGIMLQTYFEDFAERVLSANKLTNNQLTNT